MSLFRRPNESRTEEQPDLEGLDAVRQRIHDTALPPHAEKAAARELERLEKSDPSAAEYGIGLAYLDFVLDLPWRKSSQDILDLSRAETVLDAEHHGLTMVKERVLDHLAATIMVRRPHGNVLVVDDERIARENIARALRQYQVEMAEDADEALHKLTEHDFDVVITDLKMRGMDGLQLLDSWKERSPQTDFIVITGYATVETAVDALKKGAYQYLAKPLHLDRLRAIVSEVLEKRRTACTARGPVLCFTGPPGTGKTSIGRAIAQALGRSFVRVSLAGLRDEAELRGHRRTYVGAMPGRILSEIRRVDVNNPVFMLDEIDKVGQDFRGDPASVLLEILDPEQNSGFMDHYLDIPFDLSGILFIATANNADRLPRPLLDRMEIIQFDSCSSREKRQIAQKYLFPKQASATGFNPGEAHMENAAIDRVIQEYTREAGVRNLERALGGACRRMARLVLQGKRELPVTITVEDLPELMGKPRYPRICAIHRSQPGVASGLVWSETGGHTISVETAIMHGTGRLTMTGSLGKVLRESAQTALSYIRSRAESLDIAPDFFDNADIHVHIPAGSIPKDGPSAGVTIAVALASLLKDQTVRPDTAMTGELTLSGEILPVSGLRDKLLAAQQAGYSRVLLPDANQCDVDELDEEITAGVDAVFVRNVDDAVRESLMTEPFE
ncbi:S16 family serine protease [Oceanidesulfovibrio marinus]|uniref:endopeptidase La n=1 Tax=Oceanidesulfovibrio marinus TaxID=370038 RepID=A0ABX6NI45_9BACT|nr:S16 family serine protease [Oceanidesulfovibrio marinus]QJT10323.1 response regulator [Oceanidesulfovibrio marinus]